MIDFKESVFKIINEIKTDSMLMHCFSGKLKFYYKILHFDWAEQTTE